MEQKEKIQQRSRLSERRKAVTRRLQEYYREIVREVVPEQMEEFARRVTGAANEATPG